jgi:energy-coupling factor transport system ATP-binding protein
LPPQLPPFPPSRDAGGEVLRVQGLSLKYPGFAEEVLHGVSLTVGSGEHVGIIGPAGAGKTSLCLCLAGVIPHIVSADVSGTVDVFGRSTRALSVPELARNVGIIFDDPETQLFNVTVEDEVAFGPQNLGLGRDQTLERVEEALEWTGVASLRTAAVNNLSGGEKQRVAIASVLAMRPPLLILDEPTSMLDPVGARQVFGVLDRLRSREGMTIVTVEQNVERLAEFADRMYLLASGSVTAEGSPTRVLSQVDKILAEGLQPPQVTMLEHGLKLGTADGTYSVSLQQSVGRLSRYCAEAREG